MDPFHGNLADLEPTIFNTVHGHILFQMLSALGLATRVDDADCAPGFTELFTAPEPPGSGSGVAAEQTCMMDVWLALRHAGVPGSRANLLPTKLLVLSGHYESIGGRSSDSNLGPP